MLLIKYRLIFCVYVGFIIQGCIYFIQKSLIQCANACCVIVGGATSAEYSAVASMNPCCVCPSGAASPMSWLPSTLDVASAASALGAEAISSARVASAVPPMLSRTGPRSSMKRVERNEVDHL